jgi:ferritin-like metal-binding protein YciE
VGIIEEGKSIVDAGFDGTTMGTCLIAAGRCAERYGMAAYGTLAGWADAMPHRDAGKLFRETLDEEKRRRNRARIWR